MGKALALVKHVAPEELHASIRVTLRWQRKTKATLMEWFRNIALTGQKLTLAKDALQHGEWKVWLTEQGIVGDGPECISEATEYRWRKAGEFLKENPQALDDPETVKRFFRLSGAIPDCELESGGPKPDCTNYIVHLTRLSASLRSQIKARPIQEWPMEDKIVARERLRPLVEIYEQLEAP